MILGLPELKVIRAIKVTSDQLEPKVIKAIPDLPEHKDLKAI